jgi:microsomal dipeptidase-like Zn-dependent dipeptidase
MNRVGILVDPSHVGERTTLDAIKWPEKAVAITHANAASIFPHKRNKGDDILRALSDNGGIIGCATPTAISRRRPPATAWKPGARCWRGPSTSGIDHVGIGTDYSHHSSQAYLDWMRMGRWSRIVNYGAGSASNAGPAPKPQWFTRPADLSKVHAGLKQVGLNAEEVAKIASGNWLRVYREVFG